MRLSVAPVPAASILGGKLLARWIIGTLQLLLLLLFGHFVYGLGLGKSPLALIAVTAVAVGSMTCFAGLIVAFVRTREQAVPVALAVAFILAALGGLFWPLENLAPGYPAGLSCPGNHMVNVRHPGCAAS
jgi:ABC-2 type transport system permease protein